jgi:hypothetical protein
MTSRRDITLAFGPGLPLDANASAPPAVHVRRHARADFSDTSSAQGLRASAIDHATATSDLWRAAGEAAAVRFLADA